jgi:hypothetical protein
VRIRATRWHRREHAAPGQGHDNIPCHVLPPHAATAQPDPMRGGMTDLRKIVTLADSWGITIAPHLFPELNVHLLASIPNGIWCENMGLIDDL